LETETDLKEGATITRELGGTDRLIVAPAEHPQAAASPTRSEHGEYRLHGPPGTGKTHALTTRWVPRALARCRPWGRPVLIASLTHTASREIAGRLGDDPLVHARTLHSHAFKQLHRPRVVDRAVLERWNARHTNWRMTQTSADPDEGEAPAVDAGVDRQAPGDELLAELDLCRHRMEEPPPKLQAFAQAWRDHLELEGAVDFTGMIEQALAGARERLEHGAPGHGMDPGVIIVDEAQDCSLLEQSLVRAWGQRAAFFVLAGDADQAIYEWRGASPQAFIGRDLPASSHFALTQSYRLPERVHSLAVSWIRRLPDRHVVDYQPRAEEGHVERVPHPITWDQGILSLAHRELAKTQGSVMLLAPCAYQLATAIKTLRQAGIPFHNPYRPHAAAWNPLAILRRAREFLEGLPMWAEERGERPRWWTIGELARWIRTLRSEAFPRGTKARIEALYKDTPAGDRGRRVTFEELHALWGGQQSWTGFEAAITDDPVRWLASSTMGTQAASLPYAIKVLERLAPGRSLTEAVIQDPKPRLVLGTIHSVKGGEADSVILAPDLSRAQQQVGERDAITRLFYVGLTRARERLVLLQPGMGGGVEWPGA
jgi:superfamily I DNA/RNA helicase